MVDVVYRAKYGGFTEKMYGVKPWRGGIISVIVVCLTICIIVEEH
jgi:hypothetical protein